jgi:RNase P subunit RPR2
MNQAFEGTSAADRRSRVSLLELSAPQTRGRRDDDMVRLFCPTCQTPLSYGASRHAKFVSNFYFAWGCFRVFAKVPLQKASCHG